MKILNLGSLNIDNTYRVKTIVQPGETIASSEIASNCGGKGLNQSIALANAGMQVMHAGLIGEDGEILLELLKYSGVDTTKIKKVEGKSGHTIIQVDDNAQNSIILYGGSNRKISKEYVEEVLKDLEKGDLLLLQNEISNLAYIIEQAKKKGLRVIFNPSPMEEYIKELDLTGIDLFFVNELEGAQLTGGKNTEEVLEIFSKEYSQAAVVLTLGTKGAIYQFNGKKYFQEACKVKAVDTTAAGDTFTGFFIKEYYTKEDPKKALEIATKASAIAVTKFGAAQSIPQLNEVTGMID